jgi:hypothetical protein
MIDLFMFVHERVIGPQKLCIRGLRSYALTTHPSGGWWTSKSPGQVNRHPKTHQKLENLHLNILTTK